MATPSISTAIALVQAFIILTLITSLPALNPVLLNCTYCFQSDADLIMLLSVLYVPVQLHLLPSPSIPFYSSAIWNKNSPLPLNSFCAKYASSLVLWTLASPKIVKEPIQVSFHHFSLLCTLITLHTELYFDTT